MSSTHNLIADRAPLLPIAIALMLGIALSSAITDTTLSTLNAKLYTLNPTLIGLYTLNSTLLLLSFFLRNRPVLHTLTLYLCTFLFGLLLGTCHVSPTLPQQASHTAVVISEPSEKPKTIGLQLLLVPSGQHVSAYLRKDNRARSLQPGDGISMETTLREGYNHTPTCFVEADRWQTARVSLNELSLTDRTRITFLKWRHHLLKRYHTTDASDDTYAVLAAMTLGDKSALSKELRDTYSVTGASHVLALSGLHLGILYMLLSTIMLQRGSRRKHLAVQVILVLTIWAFALLVGLPLSVVRSALMISIFALFSLGHRPHLSINLLALAAIIILLFSPTALFDIGFQLSFLSVFSILLFMPLLTKKSTNPIVSGLWVSIAAQMGTAPLVAYYFGRFSTYFLLTNLIVLPLAYVILVGALIVMVLPVATPALLWVVTLMNSMLALLTKLPMASLEGLQPSAVQVLLCYVAIFSLYGALRKVRSC